MEKFYFKPLDSKVLGPGYCNDEFSHVPVLKAKVLSIWDRERALMPERSYKAPKGKN